MSPTIAFGGVTERMRGRIVSVGDVVVAAPAVVSVTVAVYALSRILVGTSTHTEVPIQPPTAHEPSATAWIVPVALPHAPEKTMVPVLLPKPVPMSWISP